MSTPDLDEIQARADAATEGPWEAAVYEYGMQDGRIRVTSTVDSGIYNTAEDVLPADAEFIAAARTDVPALLAHARELAIQLEAVRSDMQDAMADAWEEGHAHYGRFFSPNFPEFGANPYKVKP